MAAFRADHPGWPSSGVGAVLPSDPRRGGLGTVAALVAAVLLHAALLWVLVGWRSEQPVSPPGTDEITIDLAPAAVQASSVAAGDASQSVAASEDVEAVEPDPAPEPPPPDAAPEAAPVEPAAAAAVEAPAATSPDDVALATAVTPETVTAEAVPTEVVPAPPPRPRHLKPVERTQPKAAERPVRHHASRASQSAAARAGAREDVGGSGARADPSALSRYVGRLRTWLERRKRYPAGARSAGITGTATLRFSIDRGGNVLTARLVQSSGSAALDAATLALVDGNGPLPAIPDDVPQARLTLSVPVNFALH
jgi:protein TonB